MWHREFDDNKVNDWIEDCAKNAVDMALKCEDPEVSLDDCVRDATDGYVIYCDDALALVAYYGVFDCAFGRNESWEDSPAAKFEQDVAEKARELLDERR